MKKIIALFFLFQCAGFCRAQVRMIVHLTDGDSVMYNVDSVEKMTFVKIDTFPQYCVMDVVCPVLIPDDFTFGPADIDSMTFEKDTLQKDILAIHPDPYDTQLFVFHLTGQANTFGPDAPIDSISFASYEVNTNVIGNFPIASHGPGNLTSTWIGNRIYATPPEMYYDLDSTLSVIKTTMIDSNLIKAYYIALNSAGDKCLCVNSTGAISMGDLIETNLTTGNAEVLDSTDQVTSGVYFPGKDSIIYYAYGSDSNHADAGYYLLDRVSGVRTLLLHDISGGVNQLINGFDVSPDGKKLLFASLASGKTPIAIEYDLASHVSDTLNVYFDPMYNRTCLWLRYSHDGTKVLYDNYVFGATFYVGYGPNQTEIGIIDRVTLSKKILDTNPDNQYYYVSLFPSWSPDDSKIVYSLSAIGEEPMGYVGAFNFEILKSLQ